MESHVLDVMSQTATIQPGIEAQDEMIKVPVPGGVLVFEPREVGKELIGFEEVTDWDLVRSALQTRGLGVGAIHNLPVLR